MTILTGEPRGARASRTTEAAVPLFLFGARGMLAGELLRLLELHPGLELVAASSREAGASAHRHLPARARCTGPEEAEAALRARLEAGGTAALVLALPHGQSARTWSELARRLGPLAERVHVLDLAADFRLADPRLYAATYGHPHPAPDELARFVYGLPELGRAALAGARRVAAPGCFATALQLAVVPAAEAGVLDAGRSWALFGVTGSSGSGNEPKAATHHPHRHGNLWAYSVGGHRHEAELAQALARSNLAPEVAFVAHSGPFARGIHLSAVLPLARPLAEAEARALYRARFEGEPFVEVLEGEPATPDLRSVVGSNRVSIGVAARGGVLHVLLTLDNLIKGGAGQGLQCLNLMLGFAETTGLPRTGLGVA